MPVSFLHGSHEQGIADHLEREVPEHDGHRMPAESHAREHEEPERARAVGKRNAASAGVRKGDRMRRERLVDAKLHEGFVEDVNGIARPEKTEQEEKERECVKHALK